MSLADILPPSPPTTSSRKQRLPSFPIPPTSTPNESPASGPPSSLGSRKRVNFSDWTHIHSAPDAPNVTNDAEVRPLPPSRECSASGKSILKFNVQDVQISGAHDGSSDEPQSMQEVMESIVQQLIRNDPVECVDAYQTLAAAVKAYDELPDQPILKSKLHLITKSMKQHLCILDNAEPKPVDINLTTSALKVLVILVWNSDFSPYLTDEFRLFVLDRAISTIVDHRAPKSVIVHYLHFLATQDFRQNLLTSSRASRLIDALNTLTEYVKGNGVVSERLLVYSKLLDQAKVPMKSKAATWVEHMLSAMVSTIADTRTKALGLGRKACQCFPSSNSIAPIIKAVLDAEQDERHTKGSVICKKLEKLVITRENADAVPQMWAVVILLCNSSTVNIASWPGLTSWLQLIQRCFNSSDSNLRIQADLAWNRFIYAARPYEAAEDKFASMLAKPLVAQLERKQSDKSGKATYAAAMSSYCNLLYYAMRPAISSQRLTKSWNEYVVKVMRSSFLQNAANADMACRIIMSLFWNWKPTQKLWNENRAHENRIVEPEELPTIDCKWVRSKAAPIIDLFSALFRHCSWGFAESAEQAYVSKAWRSFIKSVRSASNKEIKMSNDSRMATLAILTLIKTLPGQTGTESRDEHHQDKVITASVLSSIARTAVSELQVAHVLDALEANPGAASATLLEAILCEMEKELTVSSTTVTRQLMDSVIRTADLLNTVYLEDDGISTSASRCAEHAGISTKILSLLRPEYAQTSLLKMQESLSAHMRDEQRLLGSPLVDQLATSFSIAISKVQFEAVEKLDKLFAAAFASTHRTIVSSMANTWNQVFGECEGLQIGPLLVESLQRLRPYVELRMPPGCLDSWSEFKDSYPVYDTQDASVPDPYNIIEMDVQHTKQLLDSTAVKTVPSAQRSSPEVAPHHIRHDDSQVLFVPVHSSPPPTAQESQYLTDRQREVRDRQRSEPAVVFADLRSSPRPASRAPSETRDCGLARKAAKMAERPSTPPLPEHAEEAEIQPSPTPRSRYIRNVADVEIPSSPPSTHDQQDHVQTGCQANAKSIPQPTADVVTRSITDHQDFALPVPSSSVQALDDNGGGARKDALELGGPEAQAQTEPIEICQRKTNYSNSLVPLQRADIGTAHCKSNTAPYGSVVELDKHTQDDPEDAEETNREAQKNDSAVVQDTNVVRIAQEASSAVGSLPTKPLPHDLSELNARTLPPSTPQRVSSRIDSDELEFMVASQLSNDLDWSGVFEGLDESPALPARPATAVIAEPILPTSSQTSQTKTQGRKRKAAGAGWSRSKKSKKKPQQESVERTSQESYIKIESDNEGEEMIEVMTSSDPPAPSSPVQADADGDTFVDAPESQDMQAQKKKRGRPRVMTQRTKTSRTSQPSSRSSSQPEVHHDSVNKRQARRSKSREQSSQADVVEKIALDIDHEDLSSSPPAEVVQDSIMEHSDAIHRPQGNGTSSDRPAQADQDAQSSEVPVDALKLLQQAMDAVKAQAPSLNLRTVDEMCFQIRFLAQLGGAK